MKLHIYSRFTTSLSTIARESKKISRFLWQKRTNNLSTNWRSLDAGGKPSTRLPPGGLVEPPEICTDCCSFVWRRLRLQHIAHSANRASRNRNAVIFWSLNNCRWPIMTEISLENGFRRILRNSRSHRTCRWLLRSANSTSKMPKHCKSLAFSTLLRFRHHAGELVSTQALSKTHRQTQQVHFWIGIDPNYSFWDRGAKRMVRFFAWSIFLAPGPQICSAR